jgi:hypothetical protein
MLIALRITLAASRTSPLIYALFPTRSAYDADTLRFRCFASLCLSFTISACIYHLRRSSTFYDFTSIDTTLSAYHNHRRCDFHPRLCFRPAIGLTMSTRYFNMRFWPAIGPAIWVAGLPLAFAADSSIRNRRIDRLPWASIPACDDYGTCDSQSFQDFIVALRFCSTLLRSITEVISADVFSCICRLLSALNLATLLRLCVN